MLLRSNCVKRNVRPYTTGRKGDSNIA